MGMRGTSLPVSLAFGSSAAGALFNTESLRSMEVFTCFTQAACTHCHHRRTPHQLCTPSDYLILYTLQHRTLFNLEVITYH